MRKIAVVGPRQMLAPALERLHGARSVELICAASVREIPAEPLPPDPVRDERIAALRSLTVRLDGLLELSGEAPAGEGAERHTGVVDAAAVARDLDAVAADVRERLGAIEALEEEQALLPRYVRPMRAILGLVPELARLNDAQLRGLGLETIALVLATEDDALLDALRSELVHRIGDGRFELVSAREQAGVLGCLLVFSRERSDAVHALLRDEQVRHLPLPQRYEHLSLRSALRAIEQRLTELPDQEARARADLARLLAEHCGDWVVARAGLGAELERLEAHALAAVTARAFVLAGWVPEPALPGVRAALADALGDAVSVEELRVPARDAETPVLLHQPAPARPFESLVRFLDTPRSGTLDPTVLMAIFMPVMFGAMVGDVVYGAILLGLALWGRRRFGAGSPLARDLGSVLALGSAWAIGFGFLYGEALGNAARRAFGLDALWFYRGSPDALEPLLLFALALGAAHVVLGVVLGAWQGWRDGRPRDSLEKVGTLLVLIGLFTVAGVVSDVLGTGALPVAAIVAIVGLVLVLTLHGALGAVTGALELVGTVGNILSYLRLAAVGLASVYLAIVANEFAVVAPAGIGVVVAVLLHALNVALAGFSPTVQALRLHYVEFFQKFLTGGGRPFRPFGAEGVAGR